MWMKDNIWQKDALSASLILETYLSNTSPSPLQDKEYKFII
jgi:hypothetical protein